MPRSKSKTAKLAPKRRPGYYLAHADAFEWLGRRAADSVHAVVTDPPYALIEYQADQLKKRDSNKGIWRLPPDFDGFSRRPMPRFTVLNERDHAAIRNFHDRLSKSLFRVLVPGGHVIIATQTLLSHHVSNAFIASGFELRGQIARAVTTFRGGDRPKFAHKKFHSVSVVPRSSWEPWLIFRRPCEGLVKDNLQKWWTGALKRPAKDIPFRDFIESRPARNPEREIADHPSLKPQAFMRQIVAAALPLGKGVILDPFAGSGSTLAAAKAVGLRGIGVERSKEYFDLARSAIPQLAAFHVENDLNGNHQNGAIAVNGIHKRVDPLLRSQEIAAGVTKKNAGRRKARSKSTKPRM
jgi:DNA modification methylase